MSSSSVRLGHSFAMDAQFWIKLWCHDDLAIETDALPDSLGSARPLASA